MSHDLEPDAARAVAFLSWLTAGANLHLETMASQGAAKPHVKTYAQDEAESATRFVAANNNDEVKRNIYFLPNAEFLNGSRSKANLTSARFVHVDLDCKDYKGTEVEQRDQILGLLTDPSMRPRGIPAPTATWFTGGGYQAVWRLTDPVSLDEAEGLNRALLAAFQGGPGTHDPSRLLRVPWTMNWLNDVKRDAGRMPSLAFTMDPVSLNTAPKSYAYREFRLRRESSSPAKLGGAVSARAGALVPDPTVLEPLPLPSDLSEILPADPVWVDAIVTGQNPPDKRYSTRSELVFACVLWMLGRDVAPGHVVAIITNSDLGISGHTLGRPNPLVYGQRQVARGMLVIEARRKGWPILNEKGQPVPNMPENIRYAISQLDVDAQRNMFTFVDEVTGYGLDGRDLNDIGEILCSAFSHELQFGASPSGIKRELMALAHEQNYHPVIDYLDGLTWDGKPRIDSWLADYCGAEDTELNREFSSKLLIAGVRRIKQPGVKFDTMLVLEGPQGAGKSQLASKLAIRDEWFCGSLDLKSDDKTKAELLARAWIVECQEMDGMNKTTDKNLKRFLSTPIDTYRRAYARDASAHGRHCIILGTTNEPAYMRDLTGNRRFWPVFVQEIDLERFGQDVHQLWAEAIVREEAGESITLSPQLWDTAKVAQGQRMVEDAFADVLEGTFAERTGRVSMDSVKLLLGVDTSHMTPTDARRIKFIMADMGWEYGLHRLYDLSGENISPRKGFARGSMDERKTEFLAERAPNGAVVVTIRRGKQRDHSEF